MQRTNRLNDIFRVLMIQILQNRIAIIFFRNQFEQKEFIVIKSKGNHTFEVLKIIFDLI